jgi:N-acetylmuramoyl-L-alanine amidase
MQRVAARFAGLLLVLALSSALAAPAAARPAVAIGADLAVQGERTRLVLVASRETEVSSFLLEHPDRIVVELPGLHCRLPAETARKRAGSVAGFRCGLFALGRTRLIIDLAAPAVVSRLSWEPGAVPEVKQLVLEVTRSDRDAFRRAARAPADEPETTGSIAAVSGAAAMPLVAIDAGHGGIDSGAVATTGAYEKDVVLAFARVLRDNLVASGRVRVLMTRDGDVFVPLDERVRMARSAGAELFISIHGDSMSSPAGRGATIYTGAERATDVESAKLAERENAADASAGLVPAEVQAGISDILQDLTLRETRGLSHRFAGQLLSGLGAVMNFTPQPHREAGFRVLRAPDMTSVLVELGYLSNAKDASLLLSDDWRARSAGAMARAIERHFGPRLAERAAVSP